MILMLEAPSHEWVKIMSNASRILAKVIFCLIIVGPSRIKQAINNWRLSSSLGRVSIQEGIKLMARMRLDKHFRRLLLIDIMVKGGKIEAPRQP